MFSFELFWNKMSFSDFKQVFHMHFHIWECVSSLYCYTVLLLQIDAWAQLNSLPGQFTGSTGAQVLSSEQLSNSGPQAWIKKVDDIQTDESKCHRLNSFEITGRSDNDTLRTLIAS